MNNKSTVRLDKYLANSGIASRRNIKKLLKDSIVMVNGKRVTESGTRINPENDILTINGKQLKESQLEYYMLNKPLGIISTSSDEFGRNTVVDLIKTAQRIYPIGRLDKDTRGLLLLTNDGELTHKLIHPKFHVPKLYHLLISGHVFEEQLTAIQKGVLLSDGITLPAEVEILQEKKDTTILAITLHEGRNRQIRRMCKALQIELLDLKRVAFGPVTLGKLKIGEYRVLTNKEIAALWKSTEKE